MRFVFDVDNVLYDSIETCIGAYIEGRIAYDENISIPSSEDCYQFNMKDIMPDLGKKELEDIFDSDYFFDNIVLVEGMTELINRLHDSGHEIIFCTFGKPLNVCKKIMDLKNRFPFCKVAPLVDEWGKDSLSKDFFNMSDVETVFIDDQDKYVNASNAKYTIKFTHLDFSREWNSGVSKGFMANGVENLKLIINMIPIQKENN